MSKRWPAPAHSHQAYPGIGDGSDSESESKIRTRPGAGKDSAPSTPLCQPVSRRRDSSCCK